MVSQELVEKVRTGLLLASSRTYAEQYIEPFIRQQYGLLPPTSDDHDAIGQDTTQFEIKASKVLKETEVEGSLLEQILRQNYTNEVDRAIPFEECTNADYLANIQNVKRDHFDTLLYVLLFSDCVKVFSANSLKINSNDFPNWSDKHGRYDQHGKSGQFGINKRNIQVHLDKYLIDTFTYRDLTVVYANLSSHYEHKK